MEEVMNDFLAEDLFWDHTIPPMVFQGKEISMYDNEFILRALEYRRRRHSFRYMLDFLKEKKELICAEIGTWTGENATVMLRTDKRITLYTIDGYSNIPPSTGGLVMNKNEIDAVEKVAEDNLTPFGSRRIKVRKQSEDSYKDFPDEMFDYIYIDGDHTLDAVKRDLRLWYSKLKKSGVFAGHDWVDDVNGVKPAVIAFKDSFNIKDFFCDDPLPINLGYSDWWWVK
jgi:SAM-dependent methyltransferase